MPVFLSPTWSWKLLSLESRRSLHSRLTMQASFRTTSIRSSSFLSSSSRICFLYLSFSIRQCEYCVWASSRERNACSGEKKPLLHLGTRHLLLPVLCGGVWHGDFRAGTHSPINAAVRTGMCHSSTIKNYNDEGGSFPAPSWLEAKCSRAQTERLDATTELAIAAVKILVLPARCCTVETTQCYPTFNYCNANSSK